MPRTALLLAALFVVSGCVGPSTPDDGANPGVTIDADRPDTTFTAIATGPAAGPDLSATTAAAPRLVEGEWWRIEFSSGFYEDVNQVVRVVANATDEGYIFGMPHDGWFKEAIAYHAPAFGDVGLDLSYATHNVVFQPVRFPLVAGDTWETAFAATPMTATVESADEFTAKIRIEPPPSDDPMTPVLELMGLAGGPTTLTYDARQHEVVEMSSSIGTWKVIEHGYDFEGWVTVPRGEHTAIDYGTFWAAGPEQPIQSRDIEVEGGFNRLTMMHLVAPLGPGQYRITSTPPEGEPFVTEVLETQAQPKLTLRFYESSAPEGTWTQEDSVLGAAATYSMGIAYHQFDIHLPDQGRRSDHSHPVVR